LHQVLALDRFLIMQHGVVLPPLGCIHSRRYVEDFASAVKLSALTEQFAVGQHMLVVVGRSKVCRRRIFTASKLGRLRMRLTVLSAA